MATLEQLAMVRLLVAEADETYYSEAMLEERIDAVAGNLDQVAYGIWVEKAARYAELVDISEAGSSRANGALQAQALKMVDLFRGKLSAAVAATTAGVRVSRLRR